MTVEDIYNTLQSDKYSKNYFDYQRMAQAPNPLINIVPLEGSDFFGTKVCNIIVITDLFLNIDDAQVSAAFNRLKSTYANFAHYESHIIIDKEAGSIPTNESVVSDAFNTFVATYPLADYGITYWGLMTNADMKAKVEELLTAFYGS